MTDFIDPSAIASALPQADTSYIPSASDVARFQQLVADGALPPGIDAYLDGPPMTPAASPEFNQATAKLQSLGAEMRDALAGPNLVALPESAPLELHIANYTNAQTHHMNAMHTQFLLASKMVEQSSKSVQTLYKLQG